MFKMNDKHFEVKIKPDEKQEPPKQKSYEFHPATIGYVVEDVARAVVLGVITVKSVNTLLRMAEHVVVTKVK